MKKKSPILGRVCMDMIMADTTDIKEEVKAGDTAIIFDEEILIRCPEGWYYYI